jgi:ABC-type polar amino acid transport system ATPase subunit
MTVRATRPAAEVVGLRISRLILEDFKSFAGSSMVLLPRGVCVIVGRNGSGKSNLVDALRWVFGEEDLTSLRVRASAELIAHDQEQRPRALRAKVTVVLEGDWPHHSELVLAHESDARGGDRYLLEGRDLGRAEFLAELRTLGVPAPLMTAIRQGDVGRLLWLRPGERAQLLARLGLETDGEAAAARELSSVRAAIREARTDIEQLEAQRGALESELPRAREEEARRAEQGRRRAELLAALAPGEDDPLLGPLLAVLGLPAATPGRDAAAAARLVEQGRRSDRPHHATISLLETRLVLTRDRLAAASERLRALETAEEKLRTRRREAVAARVRDFERLHQRVETRFSDFFQTLVGGGEVSLPLQPAAPGGLPGVSVRARFPEKPLVPIDALSGGQLAVLGLCLALAVFLEAPSPALILDEVEPALDEALVRRLTQLLAQVGGERQVIVVSHQTLMRHTAGEVMMIERKEGVSRVGMQYDPRMLRGPGSRPKTTPGTG